MDAEPAPPVDPRIERTRQVVLEATSVLVGELGYGRVTVEAISERSGVARSTIYRHWRQLPDLLIEALSAGIGGDPPPDTGDLRGDLVLLVRDLVEMLTSARRSEMAMALIMESHRDPKIAELHARFSRGRQQRAVAAIERGVARGELPSRVDAASMARDLAAPVFFRALVQHESIDGGFAEQNVDRWLEIYRRDVEQS